MVLRRLIRAPPEASFSGSGALVGIWQPVGPLHRGGSSSFSPSRSGPSTAPRPSATCQECPKTHRDTTCAARSLWGDLGYFRRSPVFPGRSGSSYSARRWALPLPGAFPRSLRSAEASLSPSGENLVHCGPRCGVPCLNGGGPSMRPVRLRCSKRRCLQTPSPARRTVSAHDRTARHSVRSGVAAGGILPGRPRGTPQFVEPGPGLAGPVYALRLPGRRHRVIRFRDAHLVVVPAVHRPVQGAVDRGREYEAVVVAGVPPD